MSRTALTCMTVGIPTPKQESPKPGMHAGLYMPDPEDSSNALNE